MEPSSERMLPATIPFLPLYIVSACSNRKKSERVHVNVIRCVESGLEQAIKKPGAGGISYTFSAIPKQLTVGPLC